MTPGVIAKLPTDAEFTSFQNEGEIKVSSFGGNPNSKYISTVSDTEFSLEENSKYKYLASYISEKGAIKSLKIQKYSKMKGGLIPGDCVSIPLKQAGVLFSFTKFLSDANPEVLASGNFVLSDKLGIDPDTYSKLVSLSGDLKGRELLMKLFESGYLTSDLDIPDLVRKGLSRVKIDEKFKEIDNFEKIINDSTAREVSDIQEALSKMPWLFGPEYVSLDIRNAGDAGIPDRRLKRIDGLSDILEVKLPNVELIRKDNMGRHYIAPDLAGALGQLTGYLEHYYSAYSNEKDDSTGDEILDDRFGKYYKPKGILLIGRRETVEGVGTKLTDNAYPKYLRRLVSYFHWVEVLTYDDLIERARNGLQSLTLK